MIYSRNQFFRKPWIWPWPLTLWPWPHTKIFPDWCLPSHLFWFQSDQWYMRYWQKRSFVTNQPTNGPTDQPTNKTIQRDAAQSLDASKNTYKLLVIKDETWPAWVHVLILYSHQNSSKSDKKDLFNRVWNNRVILCYTGKESALNSALKHLFISQKSKNLASIASGRLTIVTENPF